MVKAAFDIVAPLRDRALRESFENTSFEEFVVLFIPKLWQDQIIETSNRIIIGIITYITAAGGG